MGIDDLTERQRVVLEARLARESHKSIAARLGVSIQTVGEHQRRAVDKLGARTLSGAGVRFRRLLSSAIESSTSS